MSVRNLQIFEDALNGAILTERTMNSQPTRSSFPARNRLVSGVSVGVLVVQAPIKSGALITARLAMEQNRDVFALPGRVDEPSSLGPHRLIQDGAKLVNSTEDILDELDLAVDWKPETASQIPLNDAIVGRYCADEYRARVLAVRYVVSLGVAAVAVPMIAALHRTQGGFSNVFLVLAALAGAMLVATFFFPSRDELVRQKEKFDAGVSPATAP